MGFVALPNIVIFQILLPLVSPFIDIMFVVGALKYLIGTSISIPRRPTRRASGNWCCSSLMFLVIDFIASVIAFSLERRRGPAGRADWWLLGHVWLSVSPTGNYSPSC